MKRYFLLFILTLCLCWAGCRSREFDYTTLGNKVRISTVAFSVVAQLSPETIRKPKKDRWYFWYDKGILDSTQGGYSGKLLDGTYTSSYLESKQLYTQGQYRMGLKTGYWKSWNTQGKLQQMQRWRGGKLVGAKPKRSWKQRLLKAIPFKRKPKL